MAGKRLLSHGIAWLGVFCFWLLITLDHHPTLILAAIATAIIVGCSAAAIYLNTSLLLPRFNRLRWSGYLPLLLGLVLLLACTAAASTGAAYDLLWGPDPLRYGFITNAALDGAMIALHLMLAMLLMRSWRRLRLATEDGD
jgi:hypothetical protein